MKYVARGFSRLDAVAVLAVGGVLTLCAVPALSEVRFDAMRQVCVGNLLRFYGHSSQYAWDSGGQFWSQDWYAQQRNPFVVGDLGARGTFFQSDVDAARVQAVASMRNLSGWGSDKLPLADFVPQITYSHLPLMEYLGGDPFKDFLICPADSTRQQIAEGREDILATTAKFGLSGGRWAFQSSYNPDFFTWTSSGQAQTISTPTGARQTQLVFRSSQSYDAIQTSVPSGLEIPGSLGPRPVSDVAYPSQKVFLSDEYARHNGPTKFYAYGDARQDLLFHDGSVRNYRTDYTNPGWRMDVPQARRSMTARYTFFKTPDPFGVVPPEAATTRFPAGWYKWTRGGLLGWDVPRSPSRNGQVPSSQAPEKELNTTASFW